MSWLSTHIANVGRVLPMGVEGAVSAVSGLTIEATDLPLPIGAVCNVHSFGSRTTRAEVVGFSGERTLLMALEDCSGVSRGDSVKLASSSPVIRCSMRMLGRVIDGLGRPIDQKGAMPVGVAVPIDQPAVTPMERVNIREPLYTGIRAIDTLHTCGRGQRMGIFAGPGVGKSTLISAIAKNTSADVSVVALIGERGREVQEFIENALGEEGLRRCVLVVSTGDEPPLLKVRAAKVACAVAEYFRDRGKHVLLMMDSITRLAQAQRQIGLSAREPPATRGYPPSVFALLPKILERAGQTRTGSITGFYTVLVEGDDFNEPIPDAIKGISDGHLVLSRDLANAGHFPAIDMLSSISRVRSDVVQKDQLTKARRVLGLLAAYREIADLVSIGAFVPGANPEHDLAVAMRDTINAFLRQDTSVACGPAQGLKELDKLIAEIDQRARTLPKPAAMTK